MQLPLADRCANHLLIRTHPHRRSAGDAKCVRTRSGPTKRSAGCPWFGVNVVQVRGFVPSPMFGESPDRPCRCAYSRIELSATLRTAFLSAKDAKNAKRAKAHRLDVLLALLSFAFFAGKALLSITCVMFGERDQETGFYRASSAASARSIDTTSRLMLASAEDTSEYW